MATRVISRFLSQPKKHYAATRLQQGGILLDSDVNEGWSLGEEDARRTVLDVIGPEGSPDAGFSIGKPFTETPEPEQTDRLRVGDELSATTLELGGEEVLLHPVTVRAGTAYAGGLRFELERAEHIAFQRDYLQIQASDLPAFEASNEAANLFYYLHGWEQTVTAIEDQEIREEMLRGSDTSTRVRRMRRVEVFEVEPDVTDCATAFAELVTERFESDNATLDERSGEIQSNGRLQLLLSHGKPNDPCAPCAPNLRRYLGAENVTLKILLTAADRFVWTTDDAPLFRARLTGLNEAIPTLVEVELLNPPSSERELPLDGRVVELLPFAALLDGGDLLDGTKTPHFRKVAAEVGAFTRVDAYDPATGKFTLELTPEFLAAQAELVTRWDELHPDAAELNVPEDDDGVYLYVRLWHHAPTSDDVELDSGMDPEGPALGDTGIVPVFHQPGRRGDFWIAALRPDDPRAVTPNDLATNDAGVAPHGPRRFIAPLGLVTTDGTTVTRALDCRSRIRRVTGESCITFTVGDGVSSVGDFRSIQAAINALPRQGGKVAVRAGVYRQNVQIAGRRNIVLEGCGDATVLESPGGPVVSLIDVVSSESVTISGFAIRSVEQQAIGARNVADLHVSDVSIVSGTRDGISGVTFIPGARSSAIPLVDLTRVATATLRGVTIDASQRPALRVLSSEVVTLRELGLFGARDRGPAATQPLLAISGSALVKLEDSVLRAFGQVGIAVRNRSQDVDIVDITLESGDHREALTRTPLDIDMAQRVLVAQSRLFMEDRESDDAVVAVKGSDVVIRKNRIEARRRCLDQSPPLDPEDCLIRAALAWGGVHVRGGSVRVEVRKNHIVGGVGHGVTLGSVLWRPVVSPIDSPSNARLRFGPGRGQIGTGTNGRLIVANDIGGGFSGVDGDSFLPVNEGPITDLVIADNRIEHMTTNGISVITVFGLRNADAQLVEVEQARIENNVIVNNLEELGRLLTIGPEILPFPASREGSGVAVSVLPFGGIVLGAATGGVDVRNNVIAHNGTSRTLPINGIFILVGDGISISGNRIHDNGNVPFVGTSTSTALAAGVRAGIAVMLAGTGAAASLDQVSPMLSGRALPDSEGSSIRVTGNSVTQPEGRALHVVATGPVSIENNFLSSLGYHGAETATDRFAIGDVVYVQNLGAPWETFDIESVPLAVPSPIPGFEGQFADFDTPPDTSTLLYNRVPQSPRFFVGEGGRILFNNNQVTYDWQFRRLPPAQSGAPLSFFPVALLSLDHVGVQNNQFALRVRRASGLTPPDPPPPISGIGMTEPLLAQVLVIGTTLNFSRNRCASAISNVRYSLLTFTEIMSVATANQTTHATLGIANADNPSFARYSGIGDRQAGNQEMLLPLDSRGAEPSILRFALRSAFVRLLRRPGAPGIGAIGIDTFTGS